MRTIAAIIAGLLLSMTTFVVGLAVALTYLNVGEKPPANQNFDTAALWTSEPVPVDTKSQPYERIPARAVPKEKEVARVAMGSKGGPAAKNVVKTALKDAEAPAEDPAAVDDITTGAIDPAPSEASQDARPAENLAHIEWCARRYRSYRQEDNTYRPYSGGRRTCQSPYSGLATADLEPEEAPDEPVETEAAQDEVIGADDQGTLQQATLDEEPGVYLSDEHVQACMDRYRSYRPEDNSYQPFDGGPRRQCE